RTPCRHSSSCRSRRTCRGRRHQGSSRASRPTSSRRGNGEPETSTRRGGGVAAPQPSRSERRTAAAGQCALALITRTRDPFERSTSACEQISSSISATSISVVGSHCNVLGISPGQMRQAEPSLSSTIWLLSCCLICIADLRVIDPSLGCVRGAGEPVLRSDYSSDYLAEGR